MQTAQEVILSKLQRYACLHRYDMQTSVEIQPRLGLTNMCFNTSWTCTHLYNIDRGLRHRWHFI